MLLDLKTVWLTRMWQTFMPDKQCVSSHALVWLNFNACVWPLAMQCDRHSRKTCSVSAGMKHSVAQFKCQCVVIGHALCQTFISDIQCVIRHAALFGSIQMLVV